MGQMKRVTVCLVVLLLGLVLSPPAYAYLDPGSGSMLLQLLLGGIAGAVVVLKLYWQRFVSLFGNKQAKDSPAPPSELDK